MRIKLLITSGDSDYAEHLSETLAEHHADVIEVSVCGTPERLRELLLTQRFDIALMEASFFENMDLSSVHLPLLLYFEEEEITAVPAEQKKIQKYQRISSIVTCMLEQYAKVSAQGRSADAERAFITAVWSPAGGVGKTTVALACAAGKAARGKQVLYLNLEAFSSVPAYFTESGKSISTVFEMLESSEGNIKTLIRGIRRLDSGAGVAYFNRPDNFDDMNILSAENVSMLVTGCAGVTDELVIDLSCVCDERTRRVFELADRILIVIDQTCTARTKLSQFKSQHNMFGRIKAKTVLVANKGATVGEPLVDTVVRLPHVQSTNETAIYKTLSGSSFVENV